MKGDNATILLSPGRNFFSLRLYKHKYRRKEKKFLPGLSKIVALSPFIYIITALIIGGWRIWALGWIIIPVSAILVEMIQKRRLRNIANLSPFIYVGLGLYFGGMFWAWGWMIIPIMYIILGSSGKSRKRAGWAIDINWDNDDVQEFIDEYQDEIKQATTEAERSLSDAENTIAQARQAVQSALAEVDEAHVTEALRDVEKALNSLNKASHTGGREN